MNSPIHVPPTVLLSRIERLERLVSTLQKQLDVKTAEFDNLDKAFAHHSKSVYKYLTRLDDRLHETDMNLLELLEKAFPGYAATQIQLKEVLKGQHRPSGDNHIEGK